MHLGEKGIGMVDGVSLAIGFIGDAPVHRDNARALIDDLISAFKRDNKNAKIRFIIPAVFSEAMADLADWCVTSGYQLGLVGREEELTSPEVAPYLSDAEGNLYPLKNGISMAKGLVAALSIWPESRLILVADPNEDDAAYTAFVTAAGMGIRVRSLLNGLDEVILETGEEEKPAMHIVDNDDYEPEEDGVDVIGDDELDEELVDEIEEGDDIEEDEDDEITDEVVDEDEEEYFDIEAEESLPAVDEETGEIFDDEEEVEDVEDLDVSDESDIDEVEDEEEKEEEVPAKTIAKTKKPTEAYMTKLAETDRDEFWVVAGRYGVKKGPGMKTALVIRKVLEATGQIAPTEKKPAPARRTKAPAKKTTKRAPAAKKAAPVKKATKKRTPTLKPQYASQASVSTNGHVDKVALRKFIKVGQEALALAESML